MRLHLSKYFHLSHATNMLYGLLRPYKMFVIGSVGLVFLSSVTLLCFPFLVGKLLDVAAGRVSLWFPSISQVCLYMLGVIGLQAVFSYLRIYCTSWLSERLGVDLRALTYKQLLSLPMSFYDKHRVGELLSRLQSDLTLIQQGLATSFVEFIRQSSVNIVGTIVIFSITPRLSLALLIALPFLLPFGMYFGRKLRKLSQIRQQQQGSIGTLSSESLQLIATIKSFTAEKTEVQRYAQEQRHLFRLSLQGTTQKALFIGLLIFVMLGGMAGLLTYGAILVQEEVLLTSELFAFVLYTTFIGGSMVSLGDVYGQLQKIRGAADRIWELLEEKTEIHVLGEGKRTPAQATIRIENLSFHYPTRPQVPVLQHLSIDIPSGRRVALVGPSGAGKSTLIQLLLRYYNPTSGDIFLDHLSLSSFSIRSLRQHISLVPQEPILFGDSIEENIRYGRAEATAEEIEYVAEQAQALSFIRKFPEGMRTRIGERGVKLSGGQRQRIAIARALLKDPVFLILDEATSSLDSASEHALQLALETLMAHRTTLIIAHRLATIRKVDCIYVLEEGQLAESGTHHDLISTPGLYKTLVETQLQA